MEFNCKNCGECCGPIPVTRQQLGKIRRALRGKDVAEIERISSQKRKPLTCPLLDLEHKRCSVYDARPELCKMFGFYVGMVCPGNKKFATGSKTDGAKRLQETTKGEIIGVLGMDITWEKGLLS